MEEVMSNIVVAGGGPAGMTAAIYARRAGLTVTVIEKLYSGGQMTSTPDISNYPGVPDVNGFSLSGAMEAQAKTLGASFVSDEILYFDLEPGLLSARSAKTSYKADALILAMGAHRRKLNIPGEEEFLGRGVSYCAVCDGNFFSAKDVAVVGGGNTALEDAIYLAGLCKTVYLIHRRGEFRAGKMLEEIVRGTKNIVLKLESVPVRIEGGAKVESVTLHQKGREEHLPVSAVFVAVGSQPETALLQGKLELDVMGRVIAMEDTKTSVPGVFAAGDLRTKPVLQIVTACADGAVAATMAHQFLRGEA